MAASAVGGGDPGAGEIGQDTVHVMEEALRTAADGRTVVDLRRVAFADSTLLHALLDARADHHPVLAGPLPRHLRRRYFTFASGTEGDCPS